MKVAFDIQPILKNKTGVGWYTQNIIKCVSNKALELEGLGFDFLGRNYMEKVLGFLPFEVKTFKFIPYGIYKNIWHMIPISYNTLFKSNSDVYHFFNYIVPYNVKGKIIVTVYDMVYKLFPETMDKKNLNILEKNLKRSIDRADLVITISENSKKEIIHFMNTKEEKIKIVYPGINIDVFKKDYSREEVNRVRNKYNLPEKFILYLGTIEPRKNILNIIKSFSRFIKSNDSDIKLVIAGKKGWLYNNLFEEIEELGLEDKIYFTGYVGEEDKPIIYKLSELFIFPSFYEGFGMPVLEAMAAGVPVIASNTSALPEVAGDACILVNPNDVDEISYSIERLIRDNHLKQKLVNKGYEQSRKFTWDKSAKKLIDIYKSLGEIT